MNFLNTETVVFISLHKASVGALLCGSVCERTPVSSPPGSFLHYHYLLLCPITLLSQLILVSL